ncbi:Aquaporin-11 [Tupaia chinensis]|uniref:Aquaporin-11 n=1 Tax=Tupaia chinensis TaxID=246437 RepID=L9KV50_TUPCH|nr:Aquaporin-11 [Tupaia chinensis]
MSALQGLWPEVRDTCTSLALMLSIVLLVGLARVVARQQLHRPVLHAFVLEFLATLQLCCCTHELQLLSEQDPAHPTWTLTLIYFFSLVHGLTLVGTSSNPCSVMMQMLLGGMPPEMGAMRLLAQLLSALGSRYCIGALWSLGLTKYHVSERSFVCKNPIHVDLPKAVIAEAVCSFIFHSALLHFQEIRTKLRIHLLSALITFLVYAVINVCVLELPSTVRLVSISIPSGKQGTAELHRLPRSRRTQVQSEHFSTRRELLPSAEAELRTPALRRVSSASGLRPSGSGLARSRTAESSWQGSHVSSGDPEERNGIRMDFPGPQALPTEAVARSAPEGRESELLKMPVLCHQGHAPAACVVPPPTPSHPQGPVVKIRKSPGQSRPLASTQAFAAPPHHLTGTHRVSPPPALTAALASHST